MVFSLGLVILMAKRAADPQTWAWMWGAQARDVEADENPSSGQFAVDARRSAQRTGETSETDGDVIVASRSDGSVPTTRKPLAGLDPDKLKVIRDDTIFFSPAEQEVWFRIAALLEKRMPDERVSAGAARVTWRQLFDQPGVYRGELVSVRGIIRRAELEVPRSDQATVEEYYKIWLQPDDQPTSPMIVYCLDLPEGFSLGADLKRPATVEAVFFKRAAYRAQDEIWLAPLLFARTINLQPTATVVESNEPSLPLWSVVFIAAVLGGLLTVFFWTRAGGRPRSHWSRGSGNRALSENVAFDANSLEADDVSQRNLDWSTARRMTTLDDATRPSSNFAGSDGENGHARRGR